MNDTGFMCPSPMNGTLFGNTGGVVPEGMSHMQDIMPSKKRYIRLP
jgi:hypothetical protein